MQSLIICFHRLQNRTQSGLPSEFVAFGRISKTLSLPPAPLSRKSLLLLAYQFNRGQDKKPQVQVCLLPSSASDQQATQASSGAVCPPSSGSGVRHPELIIVLIALTLERLAASSTLDARRYRRSIANSFWEARCLSAEHLCA